MAGLDRIDPDQRSVESQQLMAQLVQLRQVVDGRVGVDAVRRERGEQGREAIVLWRRQATNLFIARVDDGDSKRLVHGRSLYLIV